VGARPGLSQLALSALLLSLACAGGPLRFESGPGAALTHDGLRRLEGTSFDRAWARPGLDLSRYQRILLASGGVHYRRPPRTGRAAVDFALAPFEPEQLEAELRSALVEALFADGGWKIAEVAAPDTLTLRTSLLDVDVTATPEPVSPRDEVLLESAGSAVFAVEIEDSLSKEVLVRIADRDEFAPAGGGLMRSNAITNRAEIRRTFRAWSSLLRRRLDELRTLGPLEAPEP
jgi:Protein of unknown function (DUF3313)